MNRQMSDQFLNLQQIIRIDERVKQFVGFQLWEIHWPMHSDNKQLCLWFPKIDFQAFYKPQSKICIIMKSGVNNNCNNYVYNFSIFFMMKISILQGGFLNFKRQFEYKKIFTHFVSQILPEVAGCGEKYLPQNPQLASSSNVSIAGKNW